MGCSATHPLERRHPLLAPRHLSCGQRRNHRRQCHGLRFRARYQPKQLDISLQQNVLSVSGKREISVDKNTTYYRQERFGGEFRRVIALPEDVDPDKVEASYRDGIVQITVQRRESTKARQIEIH